MSKYNELAEKIIQQVGGKENVRSLKHCITRLRFDLVDESKANDETIKQLDGVVTVMHGGGQYQVVIGNHVADVYDVVIEKLGLRHAEVIPEKQSKKGFGAMLMDFIMSVMGPCINVLCASGMLKGILAVSVFAGWADPTSGLYQIFNAIGDAIFYFFPILLGYTTAKRMKMEPFVGLLIGATLVYPAIQGTDLVVLGHTFNVTYTSTILPVIFTVVLASLIEKGFIKITPQVIKGFFVPLAVLSISVPIGFMMIGPFMNVISELLGNLIDAGYQLSPILAGALIGGSYQMMVLFGVHGAFGAIAFLQIAAGQPSFLGFMAGTTFCQTAVVFAIWLKSKDKKLKEIAFPALISGIFGVTEPAIYGITLPRFKFFIISCVGSAFTGAYLGLTNTLLWQLTGLGIFTIPGFIGGTEATSTIITNVLIALGIGMIFSFAATFVLFKDETKQLADKLTLDNGVKTQVFSPMCGEVKDLNMASDEAFAMGILGKGVVIQPIDGTVFAPFDGTVTALFPTMHAIGLTSDTGIELLIHVGIDTVQLDGEGFSAKVKKGDTVVAGQELIAADLSLIKARGFSVETPVVITNAASVQFIEQSKKHEVSHQDILMDIVVGE